VTDGAEAGNDVKGHVRGNGNEVDQGVAVMTTTEGAGLEFWNQHIFLSRFFVSLVNKRLIYDRLLFLLDKNTDQVEKVSSCRIHSLRLTTNYEALI